MTSRNFTTYFTSNFVVNKILRLGSERAALLIVFGWNSVLHNFTGFCFPSYVE